MAIDVLQAFLSKRLFDVGGDDGRVTSLRNAAEDVTNLIKAAPHRTAIFTMVAIDSAVGPDEPVVGEVMKIVEKRWHSYAGAFADSKLPTVARAILLHALSAASGSDPIAAAISNTARTMLPYLGDASDRPLWSDLIGEADRRLARRAEREWALPSASAVSGAQLSFNAIAPLEPPVLDENFLKLRLAAASGPQNAANEPIKDANHHFPNAGQPWSNEFAPLAAAAITRAFNAASKAMAERVSARADLEAARVAITDYVSSVSSALLQTALGLERRTALVWWKEALYSPSAGLSYRELDPSSAAALAAIDASAQAGPFAPRMTEAVLRETLLSIDAPAMQSTRTIVEHAAAIAAIADDVRAVLQEQYSSINTEPGRAPLSTLIAQSDPLSSETVVGRLGLSPTTTISAVDLGIWLFRDLQASAATPESARRKRPGRSS